VLAPTRELAMQIANEISLFIGERPLKTVTVYGGQSIEIQLRALKGGADIVVGTPGRVIDMMERGALKLASVEFAVLDEADEMLDMGFVEDIETILASAPENKRMLMFSATVPPAARKIAETFMQDALYIQAPVSDSETASPLTEQWGYEVRREDKFAALKRTLNAEGRIYAMIFCRTRTDVDELTMNLQKNKFSAEALHGELTQNQRTRVIEQFKNRRFDMLVATDVAARGIDVNDLTHVINYALPMNEDI
jgi:ATP-dependent RNA helicase DeaD